MAIKGANPFFKAGGLSSGISAQNVVNSSLFAVPKKAKDKKEPDQPWWMDVVDFAARPQRAITTGLANLTDGKSGTGFWEGVGAGISGKSKTDFDAVLNNLGWKQSGRAAGYNFFKGQKGAFDLFDIVNFAGNTALDPISYVTFGAGGAIKSGATAMAKQAARSATTAGVRASSRQWRQVPQLIFQRTYDDAIARGSSTTAADALATRARQAAQREIENAGRSARATAQNRLFSVDVPFTNISVGSDQILGRLGRKPGFLRTVDERIGELGGAGIRNTLDRLMSPALSARYLRTIYGVTNADDLTIQMKDDLLRRLADRAASGGRMDTGRFVSDMGGSSRVGRLLNRINLFNPRTLRSRDEFVNNAGEMITEAGNRVIGRRKQLGKLVDNLQRMVRGFDEEELRAITYLMEDAFPRGMTRAAYLATLRDPARVLAVLPDFQRAIDDITREELRSGVLTRTLPNYFPHVVTNRYNIDEINRLRTLYGADPDIGRFLSRSSLSRFNRSRTSFQNLAQLTDALERLYAIRSSGVLPPHIPSMTDLEDRIRLLENLFERTPVEAIGKRYYASIRSVAMRDLQNELADSGLIVYADNVGTASARQQNEYIRINRSYADQLGIPEGSLIHPEVLEGLENVRNLFTDTGLQRFINNAQNIMNIWKTLTTSFLPSHYWFNFVGNIAANMMVGVRPQSYREAVEILNRYRTGRMTPEDERIVNHAFETGVLGQTSSADLRILTEDPRTTRLQRADDFMQLLASPLRENLGDAPDHMFRLAHYLHILNKTLSRDIAATSVRKHLFNYNELTAADKLLKIMVPFWNWTKNNIPLQLHNMLRQPRYAATYERLREQTLGDTKEDPNSPEWLLENYAKVGDNSFYNPRVPVQDLGTITDLDKILGMLSPAMKVPIELAANRQFFNAKPISYDKIETGQYPMADLAKYLGQQTGLTSRVISSVEDFGNKEDQKNVVDNIRDLLIGKTTSIKPRTAPYGLSLTSSPYIQPKKQDQ